eukprot:scaffold1068_cov167-Amphora_coffeaeformis.AAC.2
MSDDEDEPRNDGALLDEETDEEEDDNNPLNHLPAYVVPRVAKLQELDEQREKVMEEYLEERATLEKKYAAQLQPLYKTRACIIRGDRDKEIEKEESSRPKDEKKEEPTPAVDEETTSEKIKGVPQFWICAMTQMETVGELITEEDVDCLEHLQDITCEDDDDGKGFTLCFTFGPNEYFSNTILTKRYEVPNLFTSDEPILKKCEGCKIQWKKDKSLTFRHVKKKQRGKGKNAGQVRTVTKTEKKESFFQWFDPPKLPDMEDMDEEEAEQLEEVFDSDYEVAQAFRTQIIPRAVLWFTGEVSARGAYARIPYRYSFL